MEPVVVAAWGFASGVGYAAVAWRVDRARWDPGRRGAQDFYVLAWWALAATGFLGAAHAAAIGGGFDDVALVTTLRLGIVLAFVLAVAALFAAAGHLARASTAANAAVKAPPPARRPS
ncbi:MAG TPA: hypothetical protein VM370_05050 [Candidatus Thermoplasmatota archaeon]|nr:hypothetical protein [Candidatus Thermoplasmatota archaeon]